MKLTDGGMVQLKVDLWMGAEKKIVPFLKQ